MDRNSIIGHTPPRVTEQTRYYFSASPREHSVLMAALMAWQRMSTEQRREYDDVLTNNGAHRPLHEHELNNLLLRINVGEH